MKRLIAASTLLIAAALATGASAQTYNIDPSHTFPSFEANHMGISKWRGKFNKNKGVVTLDRAAKTGTVKIEIDSASVDFGWPAMNEHARGKDFFNAEAHPTITYNGKSMRFEGDSPVEVIGELTMLGKTLPINLKLNSFKCIEHPRLKREVCGADASTSFNRADFGMSYAAPKGDEVKLSIQVEALKAE